MSAGAAAAAPAPRSVAAPASLLRGIEAMSLRVTERFWALMPPDVAKRLRPSVERVGDGLLTLSGSSDALRLNRVIGLGHQGLAREAMIDRIVARYRAAGVRRFGIMPSPGSQAPAIARWLAARGFVRQGGHALLVRDARLPVAAVRARVRVARAARRDAPAIVAIHERCFAIPASRRPWALAGATRSGLEHYLARAGTRPVAVGALRVDGDLAWLGGGATLAGWRRHGAHAALIAARLRRAARRGCRWAWVETAEPAPGRPAVSYRNLLRMGFAPVCMKPVYVWREPAANER